MNQNDSATKPGCETQTQTQIESTDSDLNLEVKRTRKVRTGVKGGSTALGSGTCYRYSTIGWWGAV